MTKADPTLAQIAARFTHHDVQRSSGGYSIIDRRTSNPVARLRPITGTDRFELLYWSDMRGRWRTFGDFGRLRLTLERANEVFRNEPVFHSLVSR